MTEALYVIFAVSVIYAALGNAVVLWILIRRRVPVRLMWSGAPGYLYRICSENAPTVGKYLRRFALSANIAFIVALLTGVYFIGLH